MNGGTAYLDQIEIQLRDQQQNYLTLYIDVFDNSLSQKWLDALNHLLQNNYHLEKNYCFLGFEESVRNIDFLCKQINVSILAINSSDLNYSINDYFSPDNTIQSGLVGSGLPGRKINHDKFNQLHRYFEDLQGTSSNLSSYYKKADAETRWHIRQLNLLCHEAESWILSYRKLAQAPDWRRPSQLMCWLNAPRFELEEQDYEQFGIDRLAKPMGGVFLGVNKAVGKHHWEVFNDEGADSRIDELTTTSLNSQTEDAGDFDIEWGQTTSGYQFWQEQLDKFTQWLVHNGFDPNDKTLTLGHPQVGQINLEKSFGTKDFAQIWKKLKDYLDVWSIKTSHAANTFDYHWSDDNYMHKQIEILRN